MEVLEVKSNIQDLQATLVELLQKFEENTGTEVVDIYIKRMDVTAMDDNFPVTKVYDVCADIRLRVREQ